MWVAKSGPQVKQGEKERHWPDGSSREVEHMGLLGGRTDVQKKKEKQLVTFPCSVWFSQSSGWVTDKIKGFAADKSCTISARRHRGYRAREKQKQKAKSASLNETIKWPSWLQEQNWCQKGGRGMQNDHADFIFKNKIKSSKGILSTVFIETWM